MCVCMKIEELNLLKLFFKKKEKGEEDKLIDACYWSQLLKAEIGRISLRPAQANSQWQSISINEVGMVVNAYNSKYQEASAKHRRLEPKNS
jgi:hypothetical protein